MVLTFPIGPLGPICPLGPLGPLGLLGPLGPLGPLCPLQVGLLGPPLPWRNQSLQSLLWAGCTTQNAIVAAIESWLATT